MNDASDAPDPLVGRILAERYRILSKLGEGAMGAVYLGEHLRMGRRDAIKVLRGGLAQDTEAIARFTRGARNVAAIRHSNVCAIYDFSNTEDGLQYLAMEFIEGETLRDTIERETRLDTARAVDIACKVADALHAAHEAGVVHRDLKPGNIMLRTLPDGSDAVKVVDFDIAKGPGEPQGDEVTRVGFVVGTPEYMSPEQLTGEPLDGRSDLYSLGVVLYRMLTGVLPFRAVSTQEIMVQRLTTDALRLSDTLPDGSFPPALDAVLARALARRVDQRQSGAAVFADELRSALHASPASPASPVSAAAPLSSPATASPASQAAVSSQAAPSQAAAPMSTSTDAGLQPTRVTPSAGPQPAGAAVSTTRPRLLLAGGVVFAMAIVAAGATALLRDRPSEPIASPTTTQAGVAVDAQPGLDTVPVAVTEPPATGSTTGSTESEPVSARDPVSESTGPRSSSIPPDLGALLYRQLETLSDEPSRSRIVAARDSAALAWRTAVMRRDSAAAALVLAQAALMMGDDAECTRWTQRGADLDEDARAVDSAWALLLQVCS